MLRLCLLKNLYHTATIFKLSTRPNKLLGNYFGNVQKIGQVGQKNFVVLLHIRLKKASNRGSL
jgi:hypothetical protein